MSSDVRQNISAYLQHVANVDVGTVLSPASRAIVGFCAEWVKNRLDEKWLEGKVVPLVRLEETEPANLTERALSGLLTAADRGRKDAEDTVEALRADLEEERKYRDRAEVRLEGVRKEVMLWEDYAEDLQDSQTSMRRIQALLTLPDVSGGTEAPSPTDSGAEPEPDAEGCLEAFQDTQAYIQSCLDAAETLTAVRAILKQYNDPNNEMLGSLTALQQISTLVAVSLAVDATDEEAKELCNRLGIDVPAWAAEVRQHVGARSSEAWLAEKATEEYTARLATEVKLEAVRAALDQLIQSIELSYNDAEEDALDGVIDADLIHADLRGVRALLDIEEAAPVTPSDEHPDTAGAS